MSDHVETLYYRSISSPESNSSDECLSIYSIPKSSKFDRKDTYAPRLPPNKEYHIYISFIGNLKAVYPANSTLGRQSIKRQEEWVDQLLKEIESPEYGYKCCLPFRDFRLGKETLQESENKIAKSLKAVILLSKEYLSSEWLVKEFHALLNPNSSTSIQVIPIRFDNCQIPPSLQHYTICDVFSDENWWSKFVQAVRGDAPHLVNGKTTHAFFAHSNHPSDAHWVKDTIKAITSFERGMICVSAHRDFEPGGMDARSMELFVENSMVTFVLLTRYFQNEDWIKYKEHVLQRHIKCVPILAHRKAEIPFELKGITPVYAMESDDRWKENILRVILFTGSGKVQDKENRLTTGDSIGQLINGNMKQDNKNMTCTLVADETGVTVDIIDEGSDGLVEQNFEIRYGHDVSIQTALPTKCGLCRTFSRKRRNQVSHVQAVDVTADGDIILCKTADQTHHTIELLKEAGGITQCVWEKELTMQPLWIHCTDSIAFIHSSPPKNHTSIWHHIHTISLIDPTDVRTILRFDKLYCMAALNNEYILVSERGDDCVQTLETKNGRCHNRLLVRPYSAEGRRSPRQFALSSSGNLLVRTKTPEIFCYAPTVLAKGVFMEPCLWTVDVKYQSCLACHLYDLTIVLSNPPSQPSCLIVIDQNGKEVYDEGLQGIFKGSKIACGSNGQVLVLHEDEDGNSKLSVFSLRILQSQHL